MHNRVDFVFESVLIPALCGLYMGAWHDSDSEGTRFLKEGGRYINVAFTIYTCAKILAKTRDVI
jgi:hypothetical protein